MTPSVPLEGEEDRLAEVLDRGGVLAIPTGSSYGLAADPLNETAVEAVFRIKGRATGEALPVVFSQFAHLSRLGISLDDPAVRLLRQVEPGPLSVVAPTRYPVAASAGLGSLAIRRPGHAGLLGLLERLGRPLTATSANLSGEAPLLRPEAMETLLGGHDAMIVSDGELRGGLPSTLVRLSTAGPVILRQGRLDAALVKEAFHRLSLSSDSSRQQTLSEFPS